VLVVVSIALFVHEGIVAVAACQAGVASLFALIGFVIASRMLRVTAAEFVSTLLPPLLSASGMAVVALSLAAVIDSPTGALAVAVPASALSYFGLLWMVAPDVVRDLAERLAEALQRG
jgi:malonyl CoA-acyl carrier protein transacylase